MYKRQAVYAASEDGGAEFAEARPSPGASNSTAPLTVDEPVFLTPGGFYEGSAEVDVYKRQVHGRAVRGV